LHRLCFFLPSIKGVSAMFHSLYVKLCSIALSFACSGVMQGRKVNFRVMSQHAGCRDGLLDQSDEACHPPCPWSQATGGDVHSGEHAAWSSPATHLLFGT
jgi:hypothetical protein